jgi:cell wall-associated NlpC family hydrolase
MIWRYRNTTPAPQQHPRQATPGCRIAAALAMILLAAGCGGRAGLPYETARTTGQRRPLARMGYSIQMGAFSRLDNAIRLSESLERQGLAAYYFRHRSGLYKVRFGDFPTEERARQRAESLRQAGIIQEYYIVNPGDYALAEKRTYKDSDLRNELVQTAESFIGLPYRWGGDSPDEGFDCSGLAMAVYHLNGLSLPRTSHDQFGTGSPVRPSELLPGDLVFFSITGGRKSLHVGIYAGDGKFIHAPRQGKTIRIDSLANSYFESRFAGARTYL